MILKVQMRDVIYSSAWDKEKNIFGRGGLGVVVVVVVFNCIVEVFNCIWSLTSSILKSLLFSLKKGDITHDAQFKNTLSGL